MASKTFLLLALALAVVLLITSEVVAANDLASNHDSEVDGRGGYNKGRGGGYNSGGRGGYNGGGHEGHGKGGGHEGHGKGGGRGGYEGGGGRGGGKHGGCRYGCCGGGRYNHGGGCKCCSTFEEATAYKQTQN